VWIKLIRKKIVDKAGFELKTNRTHTIQAEINFYYIF